MTKREGERTEETTKRDAQDNAAPETVTCKHCRYEYPARLDHCSICGYPWPWLKRD